MITTAWIEVPGQGRPDIEAQALLQVLPTRGVECHTFTRKQMTRNRVPIDPTVLIAGTIPAVEIALRKLGCQPAELGYPEAIKPLLRRTIWSSTLGQVRRRIEEMVPVFIKPLGRAKRFTGVLMESPTELGRLNHVSRRCAVWLSTPVTWRAEWRAYVVDAQVRAICHYAGEQVPGNPEFPAQVLSALGEAAPAGFSIDFGLLEDGRWALVECNDGYGLGSYSLDPAIYTDLIVARWQELMLERPE